MKADAWMPLYVADYARDTLHLTTEQHGAYMLLLMACWTRGGVLPGDEGQLAGIARLTPSAWRRMAPVILAFFRPDEAGYRHKRVTEEHEKASRLASVSRENGRRGGRPKSQNEPGENPAGPSQGTQEETPALVARPSPSPHPSDVSDADASAQAASDDPDAQAWLLAVTLLSRQPEMSDRKARAFFGSVLKRHGCRASELLVPLIHAEDAGTLDLQPYLTAAAQNLKRGSHERRPDATREQSLRRDLDIWSRLDEGGHGAELGGSA